MGGQINFQFLNFLQVCDLKNWMNLVFSLIFFVFGAFSTEKIWNQNKYQRHFLEAVWDGHLDAVKSLTEKVDLNRANKHGCTALHVAAYEGHKEILKFLADKVDEYS